MKNAIRSFAAAAAMAFAFASPVAHAGVVTVDFTASGFGAGAPQDSVAGTIKYEAATPADDILQLLSIDLTIAGRAFSLGEIGFVNAPNEKFIGGLVRGVLDGAGDADDFLLSPNFFAYTNAATGFVGFASNFALNLSFDNNAPSQVPEPGSLALLGLGLAGILAVRKRKQA